IDLFFMIIIVLSSRYTEIKKIIKTDFYFRLIGVSFTISFYFLGIFNEFTTTAVINGSSIIRHSYGFYHPNIFALNALLLFVDYVIINEKFNYKHLIFFAFLVFSLITSFSRTAMFASALFILFQIFDYYIRVTINKKKYK